MQLALGPLRDNGGPTLTHYLGDLSVAIDGGINLACQPLDQRGATRPQDGDEDGNAFCDVGAVKVIPCPFLETATVALETATITGTETYEACSLLKTGSNLSIASGAVATFTAGEAVALGTGFSIEQGGQLAILIDPLVGQRPTAGLYQSG